MVCSKPFSTYNNRTICCSRACGKRLSDKTRSIKASDRRFIRTGSRETADLLHRRAKAEWKKKGDNIERAKLFERDGWRCYICKEPTPRELMGTNNPKAPEIDHVVPFKLGGRHTWVNTACACRECNGKKGHRLTDYAMTLMSAGLF